MKNETFIKIHKTVYSVLYFTLFFFAGFLFAMWMLWELEGFDAMNELSHPIWNIVNLIIIEIIILLSLFTIKFYKKIY